MILIFFIKLLSFSQLAPEIVFNFIFNLSLPLHLDVFYGDRLGPPDYHPQTPNCPEETLTREYVQSGYRETVEGLEVVFVIPYINICGVKTLIVISSCTYIFICMVKLKSGI